MKKVDLKPGAYIINYKGGDIFKIHNIISEDGKDIVWLVNTVTEKVISQGYNTVLKNYKLTDYKKEEVVEEEFEESIIETKEDKFEELKNLEPEKVIVPEDKERPNLEAIFNKNREMELNGGNKMKDVKKKKKASTKEVEKKESKKKAPKKEKAPKEDKPKKAPKKEKPEGVTTLQEILDTEIEAGNIPEMDSKKARRLIRSRCPELKDLTVDGSKWEFDSANLEKATSIIVDKLGK